MDSIIPKAFRQIGCDYLSCQLEQYWSSIVKGVSQSNWRDKSEGWDIYIYIFFCLRFFFHDNRYTT